MEAILADLVVHVNHGQVSQAGYDRKSRAEVTERGRDKRTSALCMRLGSVGGVTPRPLSSFAQVVQDKAPRKTHKDTCASVKY